MTALPSPSTRLLRNGSVYTVASVASAATALLITPLLTRQLGVAEYDHVAVAVVVLNIAINILSLGLPIAIIRVVHAESSGRAIARNLAIMGFALVFLVAGLAALITALAGQRNEIVFALLAGGAGGAIAMILAYHVATENPRSYVFVSFGMSFGAPAGGFLCIVLFGPLAIHYLIGLAAVYVLVAILGVTLLPAKASVAISGRQFGKALSIGLPMVPHQLAVGTATGGAVLLAAVLLPQGAAAGAQLALLVASAPLTIISALSSAWTPIILSAPEEERGNRLSETSNVIATLATFGSGALALLAPWFIEFLAPADKFDIASIVSTVAVASVAPALAVAYTSHLQIVIASGKTLALAFLSPLALSLGLGVGYVFVRWLGVPGAGMMFVCVYALFLLFARGVARRVSTVRWNESRVMLSALFAICIAAAAAVLPWDAPFWAIIRVGTSVVLLAVALFSFMQKLRPATPKSR